MGKVLKIVAVVAAIAAAIPSGGTSLLAAGLGVSATVASAIAVGLTVGASLLNKPKAPQNSPANSDRLRASIDPRAFRKSATGYTALNTDIRDEEFSDNQAYLHRFIVVAAHKVQSMDEIWFDDELAWSAIGGVGSKFAGYLALDVCTEGSAAEAVNISSRMGSSRRYTGCAYVYLRYKLTGNDKKAESPFAQSVPTRITIRGKGAFFYDPRKDSTVPGGSGGHRADNQATWEWSDSACRNPALALLWNLLGWRINGELSVGRGIPKERIDLESFAVAANLCDENVAKAGGGTEPRYRCDGVWSEGDSPTTVTDMLKASMNADLDDVDGKLRVTIFRDDTFVSDADFTTDDVLGAFDWEPITPLDQSFNIVRGAYTDASNQSLYQQIDYPQQRATSPDGIDRIDTFNLPMVQSVSQAQRLAALRLNREKFSGTFRAEFQATAWRVQKNSIVRLTFAPLGFVNKTFRVVEMDLREDGVVPLLLREEDSSIYVAPALQLGVVPVDSTPYDPFKAPITEAINDAVTLAQSRGKVWTGPSMPSLTESTVGDTWIGPDGTFYERVNEGGILLGDFAVTLAGFRPQLAWTLSANQVLRDTFLQADAAYASANEAIDELIGLADDDLISRNEKITKLVPEVSRLEDKWGALSAIATSLGVSTTAAASARTAWNSFLSGLSPAWNDTSVDTPVTRAAFNSARDTYDSALYDLDRAVKDKAATVATWSGVSGSGKPQDNATYGALPSEVAAIAAAYALAQSKGKVWTSATIPSIAESNLGDTWIGPDGTFYERVNEGGILLGGFAVTLGGFRPQIAWTLSANQVLRDTLLQADVAYTSANDAIDQLIGLADDDLLSRNEKITKLVPEVARLEDKWAALSGIATSLGVSTTAAASARTSWNSFLSGLSPAWNDTSQDTAVARLSFNSVRDAYDTALYNLDRAVKAQAATVATWAGVSGAGRPADNATVGAPTGTPVGSITAGDVSSTINSGGGVANNQVSTPAVQDNALTAGVQASAGSGTMTSGGTANGVSVAYTVTSGRLRVDICVDAWRSAGATLSGYVELIRTKSGVDTLIGRSLFIYGFAGEFSPIVYWAFDNPGAGAVSYRVRYTRDSGTGTLAYANQSISVAEFKDQRT